MTSLLRPLLAGGLGGAGGLLLTRYLTREEGVDVTYQEEPPGASRIAASRQLMRTGRAGQILAFGAPREGVPEPLVYKNHVLAYDSARRVPRWVAEHLNKEAMAVEPVASRKGVGFKPDPGVPALWASENKDYWNSGWSRGHMAPAGNNKHCQASMDQTFLLTNVVPQDLDNNGNYWNRLEIYCRNLAKLYSDVWVTSGPLWLPVEEVKPPSESEDTHVAGETNTNNVGEEGDSKSKSDVDDKSKGKGKKNRVRPPRPSPRQVSYPVIGPNSVAVPTHLYKAVVVTDPGLDSPLLGAFVVPNVPIEDWHLKEFQVGLETLERHTGLTFYPELDRRVVGDLCLQDGCKLQNYKEFQQFFWSRRLSSPWNLAGLERDWALARRKGVATPALEQVYRDSRDRLGAKAKEEGEPTAAPAA